jgi:hypothetical protein
VRACAWHPNVVARAQAAKSQTDKVGATTTRSGRSSSRPSSAAAAVAGRTSDAARGAAVPERAVTAAAPVSPAPRPRVDEARLLPLTLSRTPNGSNGSPSAGDGARAAAPALSSSQPGAAGSPSTYAVDAKLAEKSLLFGRFRLSVIRMTKGCLPRTAWW